MFDRWWKDSIFFSGFFIIIIFVGLNNTIKEVGSWADWFSGILTAIGICLSLYWNYKNTRPNLNIEIFDMIIDTPSGGEALGYVLFRLYNSGNKPCLVDDIGIHIYYINNTKVKNTYIAIKDEFDYENKDIFSLCFIKPSSDYSRKFAVGDIISHFDNYMYSSDKNHDFSNGHTIAFSAYAKTADGKYIEGSRKKLMTINTKNYSINGFDQTDLKIE